MKFKVEESFIIRHKILEYLYTKEEISGEIEEVGSIELAKKTKIPIDKIHRYHEVLKKDNEITCCENMKQHNMIITSMGNYAYLEQKYIKLGRSDLWEYWFQPMKVLIPIFALFVSTFAIYYNSKQLNKIERLTNRIEKLENFIIHN